jgi:hypothetical protein
MESVDPSAVGNISGLVRTRGSTLDSYNHYLTSIKIIVVEIRYSKQPVLLSRRREMLAKTLKGLLRHEMRWSSSLF